MRADRYNALKLWLFFTLSLQVACGQQEASIRSLSSNTITPQAQISAVVKGNDIEVKVILVNRGSSPFALLKWNLPSDGRLDGGIFDVSRDGEKVEYRGIEVKRSVSDADYIPMKPGREYTTVVRLAQGYDVHSKGRYKIQYHIWNQVPDGSKVLSLESNVVGIEKQ